MIYKYTFQLSNRLFLNADLWFQVAETACPKNERFKDNIRVGSVAVGKEPKPAPKAVSKLFCPQNRGLTFYGLCQNTGVLRSHWSRVTLRTNLAMTPVPQCPGTGTKFKPHSKLKQYLRFDLLERP